MAQKTLGNRWNELDDREQEFVSAFTDFIENTYLGTLGSYQGESVVYGWDWVEGDLAAVGTHVIGGRGAPIGVEYKLHLRSEEWKFMMS
jgi:ABC-type transporter MlaC component